MSTLAKNILDMLKLCYDLVCSIMKDVIAVVKSAAYSRCCYRFNNGKCDIPANTAKIVDIVNKQQQHVFDICWLKLKFSSNVTPRFNTEAAGVIF